MDTITVKEAQQAFSQALANIGIGGAANGHTTDQNETNSNGYMPMNSGDEPIIQQTTQLDEPGQEIQEGQDCRISLNEMDYLERIIPGENNLLPVHFLEEGAINQRAVARVNIPGLGFGTGFLVSNSLFITNNHVISSVARANNAKFEFNYQRDKDGNNQSIDSYSANPASVFYTNAALDFTIVRLKSKSIFTTPFVSNPAIGEASGSINPTNVGRVAVDGINVGRLHRFFISPGSRWGSLQLRNSSYASGQHVNIVQHPRARRKEVSLQDNRLTNIYTTRVRYTTDTEPGSSGSPVFNNAWDLIALHHAAGAQSGGVWISNQGIRIDKIVADLRNHFSGQPNGAAILTELGI